MIWKWLKSFRKPQHIVEARAEPHPGLVRAVRMSMENDRRIKEKKMKLYLISQNVSNGYDTYDSAVVAATSEDAARKIHPSDYKDGYDDERNQWYSTDVNGERYYSMYTGSDWATSAEQVTVELIGEAAEGVVGPGVIVSSFNAG